MFYTYLWLREDGTPYYVGKGKEKRAYRRGSPVKERILIQEFPSEEDSFEAEKFLIEYYGRKDLDTGILRNMTDGGEGKSGYKMPEDVKLKCSAPHIGRKHSVKEKKKRALAMIGHKAAVFKHTEEAKQKIRNARLGKKLSEESKRKVSVSHKGLHKAWTQLRWDRFLSKKQLAQKSADF